MRAFTALTGHAAVLHRDDVNTDLIVRIERMAQLKRGQFSPWAFEALRYRADGSEESDFVLNRKPFRTASILISGANFGCGSSREMAVWALEDFGIRCVIAPSFGEIFYNNCLQNGVLPIRLAEGQLTATAAAAERGVLVDVDLRRGTVAAHGGEVLHFDLPDEQRNALLLGQDDVDQSLSLAAEIGTFQERDRVARPWVYVRTTP